MTMRVVSVNIAMPAVVSIDGREVSTAIFKRPAVGPVMLRTLDFDGDAQGDLSVHGGPDRAAYAYPWEHYAHWAQALDRDDLSPGQFGENLTIAGVDEAAVRIGDELAVGGAVVAVTQPRTPCYKLAHKMGLPEFPKQFLASGRIGFYLRVVQEGPVAAGDVVRVVRTAHNSLSVRELSRLRYFERADRGTLERAAALPGLSESWRRALEELAAKAHAGSA